MPQFLLKDNRSDPTAHRRAYTEVMLAGTLLERVSLEPSPVIEAYKGGIDRTLLQENLRLTPAERVDKMIAALRFAEAVRDSRVQAAR